MSEPFIVACVQNSASADMNAGMAEADRLVRAAREDGASLICLPEFFTCLDVTRERMEVGAFEEATHPAFGHYREMARDLEAWLLLGSLAIRDGDDGKIRNRSYLLGADGGVIARYDKIHLFDVDLKGGESYRESATVRAGERAVVAPTPWGPLGMTVCYDLRFAQLYRALAQAGALFLSVPAAFTKTTGEAHWHVLLRARAIEAGAYVFAPGQYGVHGHGKTYGHSLVVDPWGRVLADGGTDSGFVTAEVDPTKVAEARSMIPALSHDRPFAGPEAVAVAVHDQAAE